MELTMLSTEWLVSGTGIVLLLLQALLTYVLIRSLRRLKAVEERIGHFGDALSLLTETTESGFRSVSSEMERLNARGARGVDARTTTARIAIAARRGDSLQDIASTEQVSEGEVRLRLHLAEQAKAEAVKARQASAAKARPAPSEKPRNGAAAKAPNGSAMRSKHQAAVKAPSVPSLAETATVHDAKPRQRRPRQKKIEPPEPLLTAPQAVDAPVHVMSEPAAPDPKPRTARNKSNGSLRA
jgi:hypothetical protein